MIDRIQRWVEDSGESKTKKTQLRKRRDILRYLTSLGGIRGREKRENNYLIPFFEEKKEKK